MNGSFAFFFLIPKTIFKHILTHLHPDTEKVMYFGLQNKRIGLGWFIVLSICNTQTDTW